MKQADREASREADKDTDNPDIDKNICKEGTDEKSSLAFSLSELWQQIPKPKMDTKSGDKSGDNPEVDCDLDMEIMILGKTYREESEFRKQVWSRIWLTYRTGFEPIVRNLEGPYPLSFIHSMVFNKNPLSSNVHSFIDNDNFTTDVGWGCMIRTSQALLANTYQRLILGRDFEYDSNHPNEIEWRLIDQFADESAAPFSLHNFIRVANELPLQVKPGQWFGPNAASLSIQRLCDYTNGLDITLDESSQLKLPRLKVLISETSDLYADKIEDLLGLGSKSLSKVLILLPIRLGIDKTNHFYFKSIFGLLSTPQSVGIAGGRPSSSLYFIGYDKDELLYLDPHYPQQSMPINQRQQPKQQQNNQEQVYKTYHSVSFQRLNINELDPSMMIGILINDFADFESFKSSCIKHDNKIVHFHDKEEKLNLREKLSGSSSTRMDNREDNDDFIDIVDDFDEPEDLGIGSEVNDLQTDKNLQSDTGKGDEECEPVDASYDIVHNNLQQ